MADTVERLAPALAGRYVLDRKIGEGGMATVYLADDVKHRRKVAIKVFHPELSAMLGGERFLQEIELTASLQHPHILPLFDSGEADGLLYYVMPYVDGESLRARLDREHQLPVNESIRIACDVAGALEYAHKRGVVHRDIKPENILLYEGRPVVADFGIALAIEQAGGTRMTQTGMSLGTPHYMAPEQAMGEREISPRADIYALGAVLYEMLAGEPPFTGPTSQAIIARVVTEEPRSLVVQRKSVPPHVEAAVHTALAKIPADRFPSAAQFAEALTRADYAPTSQRAAHAGARRGWRPRALAYAPWALAAVAAATAAALALRSEPERVTRQRVVIWTVSTPVGVIGRQFAISPDGQTVVFVDTTGGKQQLYLKERERLDPIPLAGTDGAIGPTFSPDGEWIAFIAGSQLKKIPRLGGAAVTLSDSASGPATTAWLDDGTILFSGQAFSLYGVNENGGVTRTVFSENDSTTRGVVSATPLPGGAALIGTCVPGCGENDVRRYDARTGNMSVLVGDAIKAWYARGYLIYTRLDGGVFATRFDPGDTRLKHPAVPVLDGVRTGANTPDMAVSATGGVYYIPGPSQAGTLVEPVWVTRRGEITPVDSGWSFQLPLNNGIALSPDGRRLAVGARTAGSDDVWIRNLETGALTRLTFDKYSLRPWWSPDGSTVYYLSAVSARGGDIKFRRADGSGTESTLVDVRRGIVEFSLTPDPNAWIVRVAAPPSRDIMLVRRGDTALVPLVATQFEEVTPTVSPDGRWLAYASNESGRFEVYVRPFPDVNAGRWQVSRNGGIEPRWARRGRELIYRDINHQMIAADVPAGPSFATGTHRVLFSARGLRPFSIRHGYEVTSDGQRFVFLRNVGNAGEDDVKPVVVVENWAAELDKLISRR